MPSARSAALAILASSSPSSVVVKRTWPASVWRWMKVAFSGARHQLVAVLRGHLDEIAEHVVVPDLERAHAGLVGIARLQRRDHAAGLVAQRARLVERRVVARAHEAAVALEQRQLVGERAPQAPARSRASGRRSAAATVRDLRRRIAASASSSRRERRRQPRCRRGWRRGRAGRRGPTDQPRQRAREVGRASQALRADPARVAASATKCADGVVALRRSPPASVSGAASRCASSREPAAVTVRSIAASSEPRRSPDSVRISSRLARVAWSIASVAPCASRSGGDSGGRLPSCVRST